MKFNDATGFAYFVGVILGATAMAMLWYLSSISDPPDPQAECKSMATELWAFRQCLRNRPACKMLHGQDKFIRYHNLREKFEVVCGADRGDTFLSQ